MLLALSDAVAVAGINVFGLVVLAYLQLRSGKKIEEVHKATNSLVDRLIDTTRTESHAAGVKEEQDRPKP